MLPTWGRACPPLNVRCMNSPYYFRKGGVGIVAAPTLGLHTVGRGCPVSRRLYETGRHITGVVSSGEKSDRKHLRISSMRNQPGSEISEIIRAQRERLFNLLFQEVVVAGDMCVDANCDIVNSASVMTAIPPAKDMVLRESS